MRSSMANLFMNPAFGVKDLRPTELVKVRLPEPPSTNECWKPWGGHMVLTPVARAYKKHVGVLLQNGLIQRRAARPVFNAYDVPPKCLTLQVQWKAGRDGDVDNLCKVLLDSLQGQLYANDRQLRTLIVDWCGRDTIGFVDLTLYWSNDLP